MNSNVNDSVPFRIYRLPPLRMAWINRNIERKLLILFYCMLYFILYYAGFIAINIINLYFKRDHDNTFPVCHDTDSFEVLRFANDYFLPLN
jgi:hypothetical protein